VPPHRWAKAAGSARSRGCRLADHPGVTRVPRVRDVWASRVLPGFWDDSIVWGNITRDAMDNIVWGNGFDNIVWGNCSAANNIVWGNDNIVWGNDNIVWGNDNIVWGNDNIVWGNCGDNIVWGNHDDASTSLGADNIVWGNRPPAGRR